MASNVDFSEFVALRNLLITLRKIEAICPFGVELTIMSDFHTFDHYIGVSEQDYEVYHSGVKGLIHELGWCFLAGVFYIAITAS